MRLIKSAAEIAYQRQAAEIADYTLARALAAVHPGISEVAVAGIAGQALGEAGSAHAAMPPMVVSGPRSAFVHRVASRRLNSPGDVVCIERGASFNRYHAIVTRTAAVGSPPRVVEVMDCLAEALAAAYAAAVPGPPPSAPDQARRPVLARLDLVRRRCHRLGYSLGVAFPPGSREPMTRVAGDPHRFAPNMSFSLEPNRSLRDEGFGVKLGETALCTDAATVSLSRLPHDLVVVG